VVGGRAKCRRLRSSEVPALTVSASRAAGIACFRSVAALGGFRLAAWGRLPASASRLAAFRLAVLAQVRGRCIRAARGGLGQWCEPGYMGKRE